MACVGVVVHPARELFFLSEGVFALKAWGLVVSRARLRSFLVD